MNGNVSGVSFGGVEDGLPSPCGTHQPNVIVTSAWASLSAMIALRRVEELGQDARIDRPVGAHDRTVPDRLVRTRL